MVELLAAMIVDANGDLVVDGVGTVYKGDPAYGAVSSPANATNSPVVIASTTTWQAVLTAANTAGRA